ncbi:hypothetical protein ACFVZH_08120 [Streptomyces sp. NPDC059534]|uniref:DUF7848 domain-containing protein n=1 Tax=Streptomyces sp. NPDC059534 TaxID=3346859 RepID=UPI0036AD4755
MATRVFGFVDHVITQHPDGERTLTLRCIHPDCRWTVAPTADVDRAQGDAIKHTAATGHALFARTAEDMAVVVRQA